jgi:hypothetical protein
MSFLLCWIRLIVLIRRFVCCREYAEVLRRFWVSTVSLSEKAINKLLDELLRPGCPLCSWRNF